MLYRSIEYNMITYNKMVVNAQNRCHACGCGNVVQGICVVVWFPISRSKSVHAIINRCEQPKKKEKLLLAFSRSLSVSNSQFQLLSCRCIWYEGTFTHNYSLSISLCFSVKFSLSLTHSVRSGHCDCMNWVPLYCYCI